MIYRKYLRPDGSYGREVDVFELGLSLLFLGWVAHVLINWIKDVAS